MKWAILSDIHGNWPALQAVGRHMQTQQVDQIVFTGDLTVYYPFPNECIEWLYTQLGEADWEKFAIQGNNDKALLDGSWKSNPQYNKQGWWATKWTDERLSDINRERLQRLRKQEIIQDELFTAVHGTIEDPLGEIYYMIDDFVIKDSLQALTTPIGIFGHTHRPIVHFGKPQAFPLTFSIDRVDPKYTLVGGVKSYIYEYQKELDQMESGTRLLVCPGSVGQPRDYDNWASYMIIDDRDKLFQFFRVDYEREIVINALKQYEGENAAIVEKLSERLRSGGS